MFIIWTIQEGFIVQGKESHFIVYKVAMGIKWCIGLMHQPFTTGDHSSTSEFFKVLAKIIIILYMQCSVYLYVMSCITPFILKDPKMLYKTMALTFQLHVHG